MTAELCVARETATLTCEHLKSNLFVLESEWIFLWRSRTWGFLHSCSQEWDKCEITMILTFDVWNLISTSYSKQMCYLGLVNHWCSHRSWSCWTSVQLAFAIRGEVLRPVTLKLASVSAVAGVHVEGSLDTCWRVSIVCHIHILSLVSCFLDCWLGVMHWVKIRMHGEISAQWNSFYFCERLDFSRCVFLLCKVKRYSIVSSLDILRKCSLLVKLNVNSFLWNSKLAANIHLPSETIRL